jgi:hypothetical protein
MSRQTLRARPYFYEEYEQFECCFRRLRGKKLHDYPEEIFDNFLLCNYSYFLFRGYQKAHEMYRQTA